ncbi:hypothetical protein LXL04_029493 [Taraxacum kok-saghyz]
MTSDARDARFSGCRDSGSACMEKVREKWVDGADNCNGKSKACHSSLEMEDVVRAVQMRTIIGGGNGGTNLGHLFQFAADQFSDAGALLSAQHMKFDGCHIIPLLKGISSRNLACSKLRSVFGTPSNFDNRDSTLFQPFDFPIHDLDRFFHKVEFFVDLNLFQRNNECFVSQALLKV